MYINLEYKYLCR